MRGRGAAGASAAVETLPEEMKCRTSLCDWRVMRRDSVEVMHPLGLVSGGCGSRIGALAALAQKFRQKTHLHARQSFRLISARSSAFFAPLGLDGPASPAPFPPAVAVE